jgi:hypothetical protein
LVSLSALTLSKNHLSNADQELRCDHDHSRGNSRHRLSVLHRVYLHRGLHTTVDLLSLPRGLSSLSMLKSHEATLTIIDYGAELGGN